MSYIESLEKLITSFRSLPGVGYKTAQRYAYCILNSDEKIAQDFAENILNAKKISNFVKNVVIFQKLTFANIV